MLADEEGDFFLLYEANQIRIREQILVTIRSTLVIELSEAGLGLIIWCAVYGFCHDSCFQGLTFLRPLLVDGPYAGVSVLYFRSNPGKSSLRFGLRVIFAFQILNPFVPHQDFHP